MTCAEIQAQAAGLASLSAGDPDRDAAFTHARSCAACAAALAEGETLMGILASAPAPEPPGAEVLAAARAQIAAELSPRREWRQGLAVAAAVAAAYLVPMAAGRRLPGSPGSVLLAALAAVATATAVTLGRGWLAALPLLSFFASAVAGGDGSWQPGIGASCFGFELLVAAPVLGLAAVLAWRGRLPARAVGAVAAGGALAGQAALHLLCHAYQSHGHLFVFHTGGVVAALGLGVLLARRLRLAT